MRLKIFLNIILLISFNFLLTSSAFCNLSKKNTVAIVDVQMILERSNAAQSIRDQINLISKDVQKRIDTKEAALKKLEEELSRKKGMIPEKDYEQELLKFNKGVSQLLRQARDRKGKIEQAYSEAINKVHDEILKIINNLSNEKGFEVVIPVSVVVYSAPKLNITENIIEILNTNLKEVKVNYKE